MNNERDKLIQSAMFDADHLAACAEGLLNVLNEVTGAEEGLSVAEMGDAGAIERANNRLNQAEESRSDYWRAVKNAIYEYRKRAERVRQARATLQTKPVAEVVEDRLADWSKPFAKVNWIKTDFDIGTKFYTLPPLTVPLDKYNKLLDALKEIVSGWNAGVIDAEESMLKIDAEIKAIAEAEGKEG